MKTLRTSFRSKLMLLTIVPLAIAQIVTLLAVMRTVETDVDKRAHESLVIGAKVVAEFLASRGEQLRTSVEVMSSDYGLKEATATGDAGTILSVLDNHSRRVRADMAMLIDMDGGLIASTIEVGSLPDELLQTVESTTVIGDAAYHVFVVPLRAPIPIAWIVLGFRVDTQLANRVANLTGLDVTVVSSLESDASVIASSDGGPMAGRPAAGLYSNPLLLTMNVPFVEGRNDIAVVLQRSLQDAMLPYIEARRGLLLFGFALLIFVAIAGAVFSTTIAKPLRILADAAKRMISGNYEGDVAVASHDEFDELASSFNAMRLAIADREKRISHQAMHNDLTDLPNRYKIVQLLTAAIEEARRDDHSIAVLAVRVARMDEIASTLGHKAADELVVQAARHLRANLSEDDVLGHTGSNEFILVLPGANTDAALARVDRIEHRATLIGFRGARINFGTLAPFPERQ